MRESNSNRLFNIVNKMLLIWVVIICLYPLYYTVIASISDPINVASGRVVIWPKGFTLNSYQNVIRYKQLWNGYANSILYTALGTLWNLILLIPCSYAMAKRGLKGRGIIMGLFVFTMYFGGGMIPYYILLNKLSLLNTIWVMIVPGAFSVYNMIITRTFFAQNFSATLYEAAKIDGAGEFRIFFKIVLPLSGAIIAVMTLFHAVGHWNTYFNALMFISNNKLYPLQLVLRQILILNVTINIDFSKMTVEQIKYYQDRAQMAETMKYSVIFISNIPVLVAYPFVQKYFVKGIMIGSIKG